MHIAVLGESNRIAPIFVQQAKKTGFEMSVLTTSEQISEPYDDVRIISGTWHDVNHVIEALRLADAVVCFLPRATAALDTAMRTALETMIDVLYAHRVKRLVIYTDETAPIDPYPLKRTLWQRLTGRTGALTAIDILRNTGLDWTVVRHPHQALAQASPANDVRITSGLAQSVIHEITEARNLGKTIFPQTAY